MIVTGDQPRIAALDARDRTQWEVLARGYRAFYETELSEADAERAWQRLMSGRDILGFGAHVDGQLVGIAHCLFHRSMWADEVCYLQDLFVDEAWRGQGLARALIERVADAARERGAPRLYWLTHRDNAPARRLYDSLAEHNGFIRYDHPLE